MTDSSKQSREQRKRKWIAIATAAVAVVGFIALTGGEDESKQVKRSVAHKAASKPRENLMTAKQMVNLVLAGDPHAVEKVCRARDTIGPGMAFYAFRQGLQNEPANLPSAHDLFAEISGRC